MIGDDGVDGESRHRLVHEDHRHAIAEALLDDAGGRRAIHHHDRANAIFEHALDKSAHVALGIRGVEQHALKPVREQRRRERGQALSVERLVQVGSDQSDDIGSRDGQALCEPVDAIAQPSSGVQDARTNLSRYARTGRKSARYRRTRHARSPRNVGGGDERTAKHAPDSSPVFRGGFAHACKDSTPRCTRVQAGAFCDGSRSVLSVATRLAFCVPRLTRSVSAAALVSDGKQARCVAPTRSSDFRLDRGRRKALTQRPRFGSGLILNSRLMIRSPYPLFAAGAAGAAE